MRLDHLIVRLSALLGPEWLQAYALLELEPNASTDELRFALPRRLRYHHETEKYVAGVPGDLFVGFFVRGQGELFQQMSTIRAMPEVRAVQDWAIANFPVAKQELTCMDWRVMKCLRGDATKTAAVIARELHDDEATVQARLARIMAMPLGISVEPPNDKAWEFAEIHVNFRGTTFYESAPALAKVGKPFGAATSRSMGAIMVEPQTTADLTRMLKQTAQIPGVEVVGYAFCEDMLWTQPWLDDFLDERIAASRG
ncbi:MAG: hypothetical protein MUF54_09205 [Polyangiaceae bacterium]|jgi:hypothetical protein|nr:hypothetical protein [Polyangiaceae bacterium]